MDMEIPQEPSQRELFMTDEQREEAQDIVTEELGAGFWADFDALPKNVGVQGDEGVRGLTVMICSDQVSPGKFLGENPELAARVSNRLTNEAGGVITKVVFDITPTEAAPARDVPSG